MNLQQGQPLKRKVKSSSDPMTVVLQTELGAILSNGNGCFFYTFEMIEKTFEIPKERYTPKDKEYYLYFNGTNVERMMWKDRDQFDEKRWYIGNCFRTKEDCERYIEKVKAIVME